VLAFAFAFAFAFGFGFAFAFVGASLLAILASEQPPVQALACKR